MNQYDLYANSDPDTQKAYPYFVDVQSDLLDMLNSRVVIPLAEATIDKVLPQLLCPTVIIQNKSYHLLTYQITTVPCSFLKIKTGSLALSRTDIINALDFLFSGI